MNTPPQFSRRWWPYILEEQTREPLDLGRSVSGEIPGWKQGNWMKIWILKSKISSLLLWMGFQDPCESLWPHQFFQAETDCFLEKLGSFREKVWRHWQLGFSEAAFLRISQWTPLLCIRWLCVTPWNSPLNSKPEYWSGYSIPSPGDLPHTGIKPRSPALQADSLPTEPPGKPPELLVAFKWLVLK